MIYCEAMRKPIHKDWIVPDWPAPSNIRALVTTRSGGVSQGAWSSMNLADHVGDEPAHVLQNREILRVKAKLPSEPLWLKQVHGVYVITNQGDVGLNCEADASITSEIQRVCVALTADCLPVFLCSKSGNQVAVAHAGWRGLSAGVLESTVSKFDTEPGGILAWLGPAIGPGAFEVGDDVRAAFLAHDTDSSDAFIKANDQGKWMADIYLLARQRLLKLGVRHISGGGFCTYTDEKRFFSYRRDGITGRMASLIWIENPAEQWRE